MASHRRLHWSRTLPLSPCLRGRARLLSPSLSQLASLLESAALLYCRADSAKLCFTCDCHVHVAKTLFFKHLRSHLCDACGSGPTSICCYAHDLFLCHNCDWDCHDSEGSFEPRHDRCPIDGFSGCPLAFKFSSALGLEEKVLSEDDDGEDAAAMADGFLDAWVWEAPLVVSLGPSTIVARLNPSDDISWGIRRI